jgi:hypothetical protein
MEVKLSSRSASDDEVIADLARVAGLDESTTLTREVYDKLGRYSSSMVVRRIGSWAEACDRAGLATGRPDLGHSHDVWMQNIFDVWISLGRQPTYGDMRVATSRFSPEGYAKRYGSWTDSLIAFQKWIDDTPGSEIPTQDRSPQVRSSRRTSRSPGVGLRWKVMSRDRFTCVACGASPASASCTILHVDHIVPYSKGGETEYENLQTLCDRCNYGKSDTVLT